MEFGLFVQAHVPRHEVEADPKGAEHTRFMPPAAAREGGPLLQVLLFHHG